MNHRVRRTQSATAHVRARSPPRNHSQPVPEWPSRSHSTPFPLSSSPQYDRVPTPRAPFPTPMMRHPQYLTSYTRSNTPTMAPQDWYDRDLPVASQSGRVRESSSPPGWVRQSPYVQQPPPVQPVYSPTIIVYPMSVVCLVMGTPTATGPRRGRHSKRR